MVSRGPFAGSPLTMPPAMGAPAGVLSPSSSRTLPVPGGPEIHAAVCLVHNSRVFCKNRCLPDSAKLFYAHELIVGSSVKGLHPRVRSALTGRSRLDVDSSYTPRSTPVPDRPDTQLRSVVNSQVPLCTTARDESFQHCDQVLRGH